MGEETNLKIHFRYVFVCGGAVQTPALLRRSGIKKNIGDSLAMHPMVRMPALFNERVNEEHRGVPVHQVQEFKPNLTLGCSLGTPPYLALWLADHPGNIRDRLKHWPNMAVYYAATITQKRGTIRNLPWLDEPFVRLPLTSKDMEFLGEGLYKLGRLLFSVGAVELLPPVLGYPIIRREQDLEIFRKRLPHGKANITTIHLFSSCPMGEDTRRCAVNSYGKLHGFENIYLNDASILPGAPGVNPQGTIMALARRNVDQFLQNL
jgi:choline dehydrogenase-like flavoprotein